MLLPEPLVGAPQLAALPALLLGPVPVRVPLAHEVLVALAHLGEDAAHVLVFVPEPLVGAPQLAELPRQPVGRLPVLVVLAGERLDVGHEAVPVEDDLAHRLDHRSQLAELDLRHGRPPLPSRAPPRSSP